MHGSCHAIESLQCLPAQPSSHESKELEEQCSVKYRMRYCRLKHYGEVHADTGDKRWEALGQGKKREKRGLQMNTEVLTGVSRGKAGVSVLGSCGQKLGAGSLSLILLFPDSSFIFFLVKSDFTFHIPLLYFPTHFYCLSVVS